MQYSDFCYIDKAPIMISFALAHKQMDLPQKSHKMWDKSILKRISAESSVEHGLTFVKVSTGLLSRT